MPSTVPTSPSNIWWKKRLLIDPALVMNARKRLNIQDSTPLPTSPIPITLEVWDTAGQERYHALAPIYYRGTAGAIIVYDISDYDSFKKAKVWADELRSSVGPSVALVVAGNKVDLPANQRTVPLKDAESFCKGKSINAVHFETSAKTGHNIEAIFVHLAAEILARASRGPGGAFVPATTPARDPGGSGLASFSRPGLGLGQAATEGRAPLVLGGQHAGASPPQSGKDRNCAC